MLLEDLLVIDAPTLYLRRTRGGALWALEILDGATIKRLIDPWGRTPAAPAAAYQQILKGVPAVDYTAEELIYAPRNCRAHKAYGFSPVEQVQMSVNIALRRQIYQLQYYTEGNIPEALIGVPDSWNPDQIRQFQSYWDALNAGDTAERRHAKFVPGGVAKTFIPTREPVMKDVFDEWLARVICFAFSIPPSALVAQVNRATAETAQDTALSEGLAPLQLWVKQLVDQVIATEFQAPDLEFAWDEDRAVDPSEVARIAASYVAAGIKSVNEVRAELGLAPLPGARPSNDPVSSAPATGKLLRINPNHYGPGERDDQFAPADSGEASNDEKSNPKQRDAIDSFAAFLATSKYSPQAKALLSRLYGLLKGANLDAELQDPSFDVARLKQLLENGVKDLPAEALSALDPPKPLSALMTKKPPMGFDTPQQLSAYLGDPPPGYQWHHIVGQAQTRPELTTPTASRTIINHTNNMVLIPTIRHYLITGIMNMGNESGRRVGDGVRDLPAYVQRQIGLHLLRVTGVLQ
jgi:hypothetical protein